MQASYLCFYLSKSHTVIRTLLRQLFSCTHTLSPLVSFTHTCAYPHTVIFTCTPTPTCTHTLIHALYITSCRSKVPSSVCRVMMGRIISQVDLTPWLKWATSISWQTTTTTHLKWETQWWRVIMGKTLISTDVEVHKTGRNSSKLSRLAVSTLATH